MVVVELDESRREFLFAMRSVRSQKIELRTRFARMVDVLWEPYYCDKAEEEEVAVEAKSKGVEDEIERSESKFQLLFRRSRQTRSLTRVRALQPNWLQEKKESLETIERCYNKIG